MLPALFKERLDVERAAATAGFGDVWIVERKSLTIDAAVPVNLCAI